MKNKPARISTHNYICIYIIAAAVSSVFVSCKSRDPYTGEIPPPHLPTTEETPTEEEDIEDYDIVVGDRIEIFVKEDPQLNKVYTVREHGDIIIPDLGSIPLAGLSVEEATERIKNRIEQGYLQEANVIVDRLVRWWWINDKGHRGYGIFTGYGDRGYREGLRRRSVSALGIGSREDGEGFITVFVTGQVKKPGELQLDIPPDRPPGVYDAILKAGGIGRFGNAKKVHVMRLDKEGRRVKIGVNVQEIMDGELADMPIGHGDIIEVPEKVFGF